MLLMRRGFYISKLFLKYLVIKMVYQKVSWSWSYGSWIYHCLCNQCLSPLKLWVWTHSWRVVLDTTLCDKVCQWPVTGRWFFPGSLVSSTNKTDCHNIAEILLKVALNTIDQSNQPYQTAASLFVIYHCRISPLPQPCEPKILKYMNYCLFVNNGASYIVQGSLSFVSRLSELYI
jgi:hypothetical protein